PLADGGMAGAVADHADFTVLTYNVKGLPWIVAGDRGPALRAIGDRLARLRAVGSQPGVVVLQEAFIAEAREIGARGGYRYQVSGPIVRDGPSGEISGRAWYRGETGPAVVD